MDPQTRKAAAIWITFILINVLVWTVPAAVERRMYPKITHVEFLRNLDQGKVASVQVQGDDLKGALKSGQKFKAVDAAGIPSLEKRLRQHRVEMKKPFAGWSAVFKVVLLVILALALFGMRAGEVHHFARSGLAATLVVFVLLFIHDRFAMPADVSGFTSLAALRFKIFECGWIPLAILWTFIAGLHYLGLIWKYKLLPLNAADLQDAEILKVADSGNERALAKALREHREKGFYGTRLEKLWLRFQRDKDLGAAISLKNDLLEIDEEEFSLAFTAVRWCEVALPLLGFLGTVVGIGGAMEGVSTGVRAMLTNQASEAALRDINRGFSGMALAFDTTFLGLAGLIVIGVLHMALKKGLAARLAKARGHLSDLVARWTGGNSVVVALDGIGSRLSISDYRLRSLEEAVRVSDQRATEFRETLQNMVEHVIREDPQFLSIRNVLYRPVVVFKSVGGALLNETERILDESVGEDWKLTGLGVAAAGGHTGILGIEDGEDQHWLLPFTLEGPFDAEPVESEVGFRRLLPLDDPRMFFGVTAENGAAAVSVLQRVTLNDGNCALQPLLQGMESGDWVLPVVAASEPRALILKRTPFQDGVEARLTSTNGIERLGPLPAEWQWTCFSMHAASGRLFAIGKSRSGNLHRLMLATLGPQEPGPEEREDEAKEFSRPIRLQGFNQFCDLPGGLAPVRLTAISPEIVLILDEAGQLYYWDTSRIEPRLLSHQQWKPDKDCVLCPGTGGWFAVYRDGGLSMWKVHRGAWLHRYEEEQPDLPAQGVDPASFRATSDGRYLFAIGPKAIFTWEFPQYAVDQV